MQNSGQGEQHRQRREETTAAGERTEVQEECEDAAGQGMQGREQTDEGAWRPDKDTNMQDSEIPPVQNKRTETNPFRNLGDAAKEWYEQLNMVQDAENKLEMDQQENSQEDQINAEGQEPNETMEDVPPQDTSRAYEFSNKHEAGAMQTLGAADKVSVHSTFLGIVCSSLTLCRVVQSYDGCNTVPDTISRGSKHC